MFYTGGGVLNIVSYYSNATSGLYYGDNTAMGVGEETAFWTTGVTPPTTEVREGSRCLLHVLVARQARGERAVWGLPV